MCSTAFCFSCGRYWAECRCGTKDLTNALTTAFNLDDTFDSPQKWTTAHGSEPFAAQTDLVLQARSDMMPPVFSQYLLPPFSFEEPQWPTAFGSPSTQSSNFTPPPLTGPEEIWIQDADLFGKIHAPGPAAYGNNMPMTSGTNSPSHLNSYFFRSSSGSPCLLADDKNVPREYRQADGSTGTAAGNEQAIINTESTYSKIPQAQYQNGLKGPRYQTSNALSRQVSRTVSEPGTQKISFGCRICEEVNIHYPGRN